MRKKYEFDTAGVGTIVLSTAKGAITTNTEPEAVVNTKLKPKFSKNKGEYGVKPRYVKLSRTIEASTTPPITITRTATLPILTKAVYDGDAFDVGKKVTISSIEWTVSDKFPESY